jgi:hypothetical protein
LYSQGWKNAQFPWLYKVDSRCAINYEHGNKMFYYDYEFYNRPENKGNVLTIDIDISRDPNSIQYDTVGFVFKSKYTEQTFRRNFPKFASFIVAVGFPKVPEPYLKWTARLTPGRKASYTFSSDSIDLSPGTRIKDIVMMSKGLPGIRSFAVEPPFDVNDYFLEPGDTATASTYEMDSIQYSVIYRGWIVGPIAPSMIFKPSEWIDTLLSFTTRSRDLGWITTQPIANKYLALFTSAKSSLQANNIGSARATLNSVLTVVNQDSSSTLSSEAYALLRYNTEYLLSKLPLPPSGAIVKLVSSAGARLTTGTLQYYSDSWKSAVNNNDGTFTIATTAKNLSLRMTYEYGTQTKSNVPVGSDTIIFQTVNAQIKIQNSQGIPIDTGTVQYYAGAWRNLGPTINGIASKELLPGTYSFRMTYAYASKDKQQDIGANTLVVFQTVNAAVQLQNSQGSLIDQGTVQYYSGAWRNFGVISNGSTYKELLPNNYSFRMTYAYASKDKQQDIGTNPTVVFQTVNAAVQLKNSQGNLISAEGGQGTVQYYSGAWRSLGTTTSGVAFKELLPNNYTFRMTHEYVSNDKAQDLSANSMVSFSTVLCTVRVKSASTGQPVNNAMASYYSGAWRQIGNTVNGEVTKELLPANLTFRAKLGTVQQDKAQNLSTNSVVEFVVQQ